MKDCFNICQERLIQTTVAATLLPNRVERTKRGDGRGLSMSLSATNAGTTKPPTVFGLWMLKREGDSIRFYLKSMIVKL